MSAPLLRISVDLATGLRTVACGGCGAEAALEAGEGATTRSATMTAFVAAHGPCHADAGASGEPDLV